MTNRGADGENQFQKTVIPVMFFADAAGCVGEGREIVTFGRKHHAEQLMLFRRDGSEPFPQLVDAFAGHRRNVVGVGKQSVEPGEKDGLE